jgi:hypothetical protein
MKEMIIEKNEERGVELVVIENGCSFDLVIRGANFSEILETFKHLDDAIQEAHDFAKSH